MRRIFYTSCTSRPNALEIRLNAYGEYSADLEITVQMLVQVDKLVQLIESPVFTCKQHLTSSENQTHFTLQTSGYSFLNPRDTHIFSSASTVY
jgi:hypothetical protein